MGLAKALLEEQNKRHGDHNDDVDKDREHPRDAGRAF